MKSRAGGVFDEFAVDGILDHDPYVVVNVLVPTELLDYKT